VPPAGVPPSPLARILVPVLSPEGVWQALPLDAPSDDPLCAPNAAAPRTHHARHARRAAPAAAARARGCTAGRP
jgi:hypothetical protein